VILAVTEQIPLIHKRFPIKTQRGTIEKVAVKSLVQSHSCHQVRFNNSARRSEAPTGIAETKRKLLELNNLKMKTETQEKKTQDKYSG
jgi:hypothetical protein